MGQSFCPTPSINIISRIKDVTSNNLASSLKCVDLFCSPANLPDESGVATLRSTLFRYLASVSIFTRLFFSVFLLIRIEND